jgi:hypothetical protein
LRAGPDEAQLRTKFFQLGMDGLCTKQATNYGIATGYKGLGTGGVYPDTSSITTTVAFAGNASACPAQGPTQSPHVPGTTSLVTECWVGAPSSMYVALDLMCQLGNTSFDQVGPGNRWLCVRVSVCPFACLSTCPCIRHPFGPETRPFRSSAHPSLCPSAAVCLSVCLSVCHGLVQPCHGHGGCRVPTLASIPFACLRAARWAAARR